MLFFIFKGSIYGVWLLFTMQLCILAYGSEFVLFCICVLFSFKQNHQSVQKPPWGVFTINGPLAAMELLCSTIYSPQFLLRGGFAVAVDSVGNFRVMSLNIINGNIKHNWFVIMLFIYLFVLGRQSIGEFLYTPQNVSRQPRKRIFNKTF